MHLLLTGDTGGVDIEATGSDLVGVRVGLEDIEELQVRLGSLNRDDISIESNDVSEDGVEVGVTEVRVDLGLVLDSSGGETERVDSPGEVLVPVDLTEGKSFTNGGLVDLDGEDTGSGEIVDLITEGKSKLLALNLSGDIDTRVSPVEDGDGTGKHSLDGGLGKSLGVGGPLDGHRGRSGNIGDDDGRTNVSGSVTNASTTCMSNSSE